MRHVDNMDDTVECQALLIKEYLSENEPYHPDTQSSSEDSCSNLEEWWTGTGSETISSTFSSYTDSDYDCSCEWEQEVSPRGELFYVESSFPDSRYESSKNIPENNTTKETQTSRRNHLGAKGKLSQFIQRRSSKRLSKTENNFRVASSANQEQCPTSRTASSNKVTFKDLQQGETRIVHLFIDAGASQNLGRRATISETFLGLIFGYFSDGKRIMISGFIPNGEAAKCGSIKIGDWLQSVDGQDVDVHNIDMIMNSLKPPCQVSLQLQRIAGCEVTLDPPMSSSKSHWQTELVQKLLGQTVSADLTSVLTDQPLIAMYLNHSVINSEGPEDEGILYCYPPYSRNNLVARSRGAFLTLQHLLPELCTTEPVSSTVITNGMIVHIIYETYGEEIFLLAVPEERCSLWEALQYQVDIIRNVEFCYKTVSGAFSDKNNHSALDHLFSLYFANLLSGGQWLGVKQCVKIQDLTVKANEPSSALFEDLLPYAHWVPLPHHTQVLAENILSHLETNDFGDMDDEDIDHCQRLYTIMGTCLYHKGVLLVNHLTRGLLEMVHSFCRQQGLLRLIREEPVRVLLLWREVFCADSEDRNFLLIVGQEHDILVVVLESGGCAAISGENPGPDVCYVEVAQEALSHLHKVGIPSVADKWLSSNCRPQIVRPENITIGKAPRRSDNFLGFVRQIEPSSPTKTSIPPLGGSPVPKKKVEVTSILKRSSPDRNFPYISSGLSHQGSTSEDSASQVTSVTSEISDESAPILGRRAERERSIRHRLSESPSENSDNTDSDWEDYRVPVKDVSLETSDCKKNLISDMDGLLPTKLTFGEENLLFHFVDLCFNEGVLLYPPTNMECYHSHKMQDVLNNFRLSCQAIHKLLQTTVSFKKLMAQEVNKSVINKSLIAIKEYGMLFEISNPEQQNIRKSFPLTYWVVGRLLFSPHPREVYVCYHDSAPQNMVEIAFRLALSRC